MRILRKHDAEIESHPDYTCMRCEAEKVNPYIYETEYLRVAKAYSDLFQSTTSIGGYPILAIISDHATTLCPSCAKKAFILGKVDITIDVHYEGPAEYCEDCGREIESAYGNPEEEE